MVNGRKTTDTVALLGVYHRDGIPTFVYGIKLYDACTITKPSDTHFLECKHAIQQHATILQSIWMLGHWHMKRKLAKHSY